MRGPKQKQEVEPKSSGASKPVSLHPLTFDESLDAILSVPPPKDAAPKEAKKQAAKKTAKK